MWNLVRRRKKEEKNIESSKHIRTRKAQKNNAGFTLVELIVAVTVFALMVPTLTSAFIASARINSKGRQQEQAMTIAQNLMEGIKYFGLADLAKQVNTDTFKIVSNGSGSGVRSLDGTDNSASYDGTAFVPNTNGDSYSFAYTDADGASKTASGNLAKYEYLIEDILMGSTYYDAKIVIEQSDDETYLLAQTDSYKTYFEDLAMNSLKYYEVTIDVYLSDDATGISEDGHRATYTGTFTDKN